MKCWRLHELDLKSRLPEILASGADARAVALDLAAGESLNEHEVRATSPARLLLLLTPWPGRGHPGAMTLTQKLYARRRAAKQRKGAAREGI